MKVIIAGGRDISDYKAVEEACAACGWPITEVVSGTARGVDRLGEQWAEAHNVPVKRMSADWDRFGKRAGYLRNQEMVNYADALILVWSGTSNGSAHTLAIAKTMNHIRPFKIYEVIVPLTDEEKQGNL